MFKKGTNNSIENTYKIDVEQEYRKAKAKLARMQKNKKRLWLTIPICFIIFVCILLSEAIDTTGIRHFNFSDALFPIIFSIALCSMLSLYLFIVSELSTTKLERQILEYESVHIQKDIKNDIFENSIRMSYNYLDQYYKQTREQAQKGFWITVAISIVGAILIFVGVIAMFFGKTEPSYITCAVGAITEFISAIFFYLYNKTISSMSQYHNKLVLSQNISIALKVADSLPEDKQAEAKSTIVNELLKDINTYLVEEESTKK